MVKVCVVGCLHGELDRVYDDISLAEQRGQFKTDLVLCCGDFQSLRNPADLASMSVPPKYYNMGDFWRFYSEEIRAPILTIFVGGNHESSWYLQELPYGGWVAPNIWYMGYASVVQFAGLRIAGLSGIYKPHDYTMCHYEHAPYTEGSKRSVYHIRNLDVFRLGQIRRRLDIFLSHDWPRGIYHYGNTSQLIRSKPLFRQEIQSDSLGSPSGEQLLCRLKPRYWFAAHLHCKFSAVVQHKEVYENDKLRVTKFLALDKCLPKRNYLQFIDIEPECRQISSSDNNTGIVDPIIVSLSQSCVGSEDRTNLYLDPEWLCILKLTNHLMSINQVPCILPEKQTTERCDFSPTDEEIKTISEPFGGEFGIPNNFERTAPIYKPEEHIHTQSRNLVQQSNFAARTQQIFSNPQTELLCAMLELINPNALWLGKESYNLPELYDQLNTKNNDDDEDDEDDVVDDNDIQEKDTGNVDLDLKDCGPNSSYVGIKEDHSEYDPMDSTFVSYVPGYSANMPNCDLGDSVISRNPEELLLDLDDDDVEDRYDDEKQTKAQFHNEPTSPFHLSDKEAYIPQPAIAVDSNVENNG